MLITAQYEVILQHEIVRMSELPSYPEVIAVACACGWRINCSDKFTAQLEMAKHLKENG